VQPVIVYTGVVEQTDRTLTDAATPRGLQRLEAFLNTLDERSFVRRGQRHLGGDLLAGEEALAGWLTARGLLRPSDPVDRDSFALALALRRSLRGALAARAGLGADSEAATVLRSLPLCLDVDRSGTVRLLPLEGDGARGAIASLAAEVANAVSAGTWSRLKMCASPECRWIIYDGSRNGLGRWCAMGSCGNRAKTRTYRRRRTVSKSAVIGGGAGEAELGGSG
jgi:predicted RNA-binding Zn ribbon-like protein